MVSGACCSRAVARGTCSSRVGTGSSSEDDRLLLLRRFLDLTLGSFFAFFFFFTFFFFFLVLSGVSGGGGKGSNAELHDDMSSSQATPSAPSTDMLAESQTAAVERDVRSIDDSEMPPRTCQHGLMREKLCCHQNTRGLSSGPESGF